jgi:hypothetical protein
MSRVTSGDHIRLLLTGNTEEEKWESILYINQLKRDPSIAYFFAGFKRSLDSEDNINENWSIDEWSADEANRKFEEMIKANVFST